MQKLQLRFMKKLFHSIGLLAAALSVSAQNPFIQKTATFDFHNYETLNPKVVFTNSTVCGMDDKTFVSDVVSFKAIRTDLSLSPVLNKNIKEGWAGFSFPSYAEMTVSVPAECQIEKIDFTVIGFYNGVSGLKVKSTSESSVTGSYFQGLWNALDSEGNHIDGITSVTFTNLTGLDITFSGIEVSYMSPADVLTYNSVSPAIDEETDPFTGYTLTFAQGIIVDEDVAFNVTDNEDNVVSVLHPSLSDDRKELTLTPDEPIVKPGSYTLAIPSATFKCVPANAVIPDGQPVYEYNKPFELTFSVKDHEDSFNAENVVSVEGKVKEIPQTLTLTFPGTIGSTTLTTLSLMDSEEAVASTAEVTFDSNELALAFPAPITELGAYTLSIPENSVTDEDGSHYNKALTLTFEVMGYDVPSDELIGQARNLLALTGAGYPKTHSSARLALEGVVNDETSSLQQYEEAIDAFISTDDIAFPQYGKYYTFQRICDSGAGNLHIGYSDDGFYTTDDENDAEHFLFVDAEGDRYVQTTNGTQAAISLSKATNAEPLKAFGLFDMSIDGFADDTARLGYKLSVTTSRDPNNEVAIYPADGTQTDDVPEVIITVDNVEKLTYHTDNPIRILKGGEEMNTVTDVIIDGNQLTFALSLPVTVEAVAYTVDVPKGAVTYYSIDHDVEVPAVRATYTLSYEYGFKSFTSKYILYYAPDPSLCYTPEMLENVTVSSNETELFVNPDFCKTYVMDLQGKTLFSGTLAKDNETDMDIDGYSNLKFQFNTPFTRSNMPDGQYVFHIEKGSFGDANFGEYLLNPVEKKKNECYVNTASNFLYTVNYEQAMGITSTDADAHENKTFDLSGRHVIGDVKPGIYITNGKKVVVK